MENIVKFDIVLTPPYPHHWNGLSASQIREYGFKFDEKIPDCAVYKNGAFEYITIDFTIKGNIT